MIPGTQPSPQKIYPGSADDDSLGVFDMSVNDTSMYGNFSVGVPVSAEGTVVSSSVNIDPEFAVITPTMSAQYVEVVRQVIVNNMGPFMDELGDQLYGGDF